MRGLLLALCPIVGFCIGYGLGLLFFNARARARRRKD